MLCWTCPVTIITMTFKRTFQHCCWRIPEKTVENRQDAVGPCWRQWLPQQGHHIACSSISLATSACHQPSRPRSDHISCSPICEGVSNTITLLRFLVFCFSVNFTTGPMGSNMFCRISQNCEQIFRLNFLYGQGGHPTLFWKKKNGEFFVKIWHFGPLEVLWASASSTRTTPTTPSVQQ